MKLCWLMTMFQSDAASAHRRPSLVSDKHAPALQFQSVSPCRLCCTGVVFMQPLVKENGAYYCDVLLLKQLLPNICQAASDSFFPTTHAKEHFFFFSSAECSRDKLPFSFVRGQDSTM